MRPQLVILAGGLGTRLRGIIADRPKPMAPVNGRPFLEHVLRALRAQGFDRALLCVGYRGEMISDHFGDGSTLGLHLTYAREPEGALLGTAGALRAAASALEPVFVLLNGDTHLDADLKPLLAAHRPGTITVGLVRVPNAGRYGAVELRADGTITRFAEKSSAAEGVINAGVYVVDRVLVESLPDGAPLSLERDVFPDLTAQSRLRGVILQGAMTDIGTPDSYAHFQLKDRIAAHLSESADVLRQTLEGCGPAILGACEALVACHRAGRQSLWCGNGGSAADAQHLVAELVSKLTMERRALPAIALTTNTSVLTAIANDYAFDQVFARQVDAYARPGDTLVVITTSGNSPSALEAARRAKALGAQVIGLTGRGGGRLAPLCDHAIVIPSANTQHIQEAHICVGHILCEAVEQGLFGR